MIYFQKKTIFYGSLLLLLAFKFVYVFEPSHLWDEATYALIAQELLKGSLPYIDYWDNKPPVLFIVIAIWFVLFGKSVEAYFLLAIFILCVNSLYLRYLLQKTIYAKYSNLAAILLLASSCAGLNGIYSEYFIIIPLLYSIDFLVFTDIKKRSQYEFFFFGALLSIAVLIRANLWFYPLLCLFIIYGNKDGIDRLSKKIALFILGGFGVFGIILLPYLMSNALSNFMDFIHAALTFASPSNFLSSGIGLMLCELNRENSIFYIMMIFIGGSFLYLNRLAFKKILTRKKINFLILFLGTLISVLSIGGYYHHYSLHWIAFAIIIFIFFVYHTPKKMSKGAIILVLLAILVPIINSLGFVHRVTTAYSKTGTFFSDPAYQMKNIIETACDKDCTVFANNHILLFLLGHKPNHFLVHPSNLTDHRFSHYFFTSPPIDIAEKLFLSKPKYITYSELNLPFENNVEIKELFNQMLQKHYKLVKQIGHSKLYQRNNV